jgi:hypothetical protein
MKKDEIQILRSYIKEGSLIEYSMLFPNNLKLVNEEDLVVGKKQLIDEQGKHITWLEYFENWNEQSNEIIGSSHVSYTHPSNEYVIAEMGTKFDALGPIDSTSKSITIEDLLNGKYTKLAVDGNKII